MPDEGERPPSRRSKRQQENAAAAAGRTASDAADAFRTAVAALQGLDPAVLQAVVTAATTKNQIRAVATSTAAEMVGGDSPRRAGKASQRPGVFLTLSWRTPLKRYVLN